MRITHMLGVQVYLVPEISRKLLTYDRLRWYRAASKNGLYEPATATSAQPAIVRSFIASRALAGKKLRLVISRQTVVEVTFAGPDPISYVDAASQINDASALVTAIAIGDLLELSSAATGSAVSIEVAEGSDAAPSLGLVIGDGACGLDADSTLAPGISEYRFSDYQSSAEAWYQVEFRHTATALVSSRSVPFQARSPEAVPLAQLIGCFVRLADLSGRPIAGRRIFIHNVFMPNRVTALDGRSWGLFRQYEELVTDSAGYAEVLLVRGATIDVTIAGSGLTRRVTLPQGGTIVDLLDPLLNAQDEFGIQTPGIDFAIRTTT